MNKENSRNDESGQKKQRKGKNTAFRSVMKFIAAMIMLCIIAGCVFGCYLTLFVFDTLETSEVVNLDLDQLKLNYTSIIYATNTETGEWGELQRLEDGQGSRVWVDYEKMPPHLFDVLIAVEDKRFTDHNGVDWLGTVKAGFNYVLNKVGLASGEDVRGASTITQQLVRNITEDYEDSPSRKLREIFRAIKVEQHYSKDQIIEAYLNTVAFGNNTHGIQAASYLYFNKDVAELSIAQCASIVGVTKAPTTFNPYTNYDKNQGRKEDILFLMHQQGMLSNSEYEDALDEEIVFNTANNERRTSFKQSYFVDFLMDQVIADLSTAMEISKEEASNLLYRGGYRIYSTVDTGIQTKIETIYSNTEQLPTVSNKGDYPQSSFIVTDTGGAIKGLVGGIGEKEGARVWNRATDTQRQPGSTIKPISSYVLSIESDLAHWSSLMLDGPYNLQIEKQPPWRPRNYYNEYKGYMILEEALQRSCNMVPVRMIVTLSPMTAWSFMHDTLGIQSLVPSDQGPSPMSLGALTYGVTPLEMAGAYQMFSNGGLYTPPYTYTHVLDTKGNVVLQRNTTPTRVISFDTATIVNKLMQRVVSAVPGTGRTASLAKTNPSLPVAGKTGTTDDDVDQWFIGMTPYYVGVCWMGYDEQFLTEVDENGKKTLVLDAYGNKIPNSIKYRNYPPPILWNTVMTAVHDGLEAKPFTSSSNVVSLTYCLDTGYAATTECTRKSTGWYKSTNIPTSCPMHGIGFETEYKIAGQKPWLDEWAPLDPQWSWLYYKPEQLDEFGMPKEMPEGVTINGETQDD